MFARTRDRSQRVLPIGQFPRLVTGHKLFRGYDIVDAFGQRRLPGALRGAKGGVAAVGGDAKATHRSARTCRYQTPDDDVFLQAVERVDRKSTRLNSSH